MAKKRASGSRRAACACVFALPVAIGVGLGSAAGAVPVVYQSPADDGVDPGTPFALSGAPTESLYLYVDSGPLASVVGAYYYLRVIWYMYFDKAEDRSVFQANADTRLVLSLNGLAVLALGIVPGWLLKLCFDVIG